MTVVGGEGGGDAVGLGCTSGMKNHFRLVVKCQDLINSTRDSVRSHMQVGADLSSSNACVEGEELGSNFRPKSFPFRMHFKCSHVDVYHACVRCTCKFGLKSKFVFLRIGKACRLSVNRHFKNSFNHTPPLTHTHAIIV